MSRSFSYGLHVALPKGSMEAGAYRLLNAGLERRNMSITWRGYDGFISGGGVHRISKLRPQDSPVYLAREDLHACLTGQDCIKELELEDKLVEISEIPLTRAGNSSVVLAVFVDGRYMPWMENIEDVHHFQEKGLDEMVNVYTPWMHDIQHFPKLRVVTEYPNIAKQYFQEKGINVDIDVCHGACEAIVAAGFAVLGVDVVDSGNTLVENRMNVIDIVMTSSAVFVTNKEMWNIPSVRSTLQDFADMLLEEANMVAD